MLKRILVLLADTASSLAARDYAFRLAKQSGAEVAGLAGIDLSVIEVHMPGGLGASTYRARLEEELKAKAIGAQQRIREAFERQCRDNGVAFEYLSFEGDPVEALQRAAETRDLVISGHDTALGGNDNEPVSEMLSRLLQMVPRPLVICPDALPATDSILVACDGSVAAMRTIQLFALLGVGNGRSVSVTSIDPNRDTAARCAGAAAVYLQSHGVDVSEEPIASGVHASEVLRSEAAQRKIGTLVMGAFGHRGFREMLFGSTTNSLIENPPCALFVYH